MSSPLSLGDDEEMSSVWSESMPRAAGGLVYRFGTQRQDRDADVVVAVDDAGHELGRRVVVWRHTDSFATMTGELASGEGGMARVIGDAIVFHGAGGSSVGLGTMPAMPAPCDAGTVTARLYAAILPFEIETTGLDFRPTGVVYAVVNGTACVEMTVGSSDSEGRQPTAMLVGDHGQLHGALVGADGRGPEITCTARP
jgi:hypothetical protein